MRYLLLALLLSSGSVYALDKVKKKYKINAEATRYSGVEDIKFNVKNPNVDYEFSLLDTNIQLRGFSQDKSQIFYADELEEGFKSDPLYD